MSVKYLSYSRVWAWGLLLGMAALLLRSRRRAQPFSLTRQVVVITGASSGIGRAAAHAFAQAGASVALVARRPEALAAVEAELGCYGVETLVVPADVTRSEELERLVEKVLGTFGRIDVLVNNAGISRGGSFITLEPDDLRQLLLTNVYGPLRLTQLVLPCMLRRGS